MDRISRDSMFMGFAELAAKRSTCYRRSVGAILVANNNVLSVGYNGPPSGEDHCTGITCPSNNICSRAVHAEKNLFDRCTIRSFHSIPDSRIYVTESPCPECAQLVLDKGVRHLYYLNQYRLVQGLEILAAGGVKVYRMTPAGYVIDYTTNELVNP